MENEILVENQHLVNQEQEVRELSYCFYLHANGNSGSGKENVIVVSGRYAGESKELIEMQKLPAGVIDKSVCGCGLTSFAIEQERGNVVIAVPTQALVKNKVKQYPNNRYNSELFEVTGDTKVEDVAHYIDDCEGRGVEWKVMVTYDSLWKLTVNDVLDRAHLIIDEWHMMNIWSGLKSDSRSAKNFQIDVMTRLLRIAKKYKDSVTFITATPIALEYMADWVGELNKVKLEWSVSVEEGPLYKVKGKKPIDFVKNKLINVIEKKGVVRIREYECKKLIVFVNSIEAIKEMCNGVIDKEKCAIICGDKEVNDEKISSFAHRLEDPTRLPRYTFVTSSGWQGIDLEDKEAVSVVVSYGGDSSFHTLVDVNVQLKQILGRQRDMENPSYHGGIFVYSDLAEEIINREKERLEEEASRVRNNLAVLELEGLSNEQRRDLKTSFMDLSLFRLFVNPKEGNPEGLEFNELYYRSKLYEIDEILPSYVIRNAPSLALDENGDIAEEDVEVGIRLYRDDAIEIDGKNLRSVINRDITWKRISELYRDILKGADSDRELTEEQKKTSYYETIEIFYKLYDVNVVDLPKTEKIAQRMIKIGREGRFVNFCRARWDYNGGRYGEGRHCAEDIANFLNGIAKEVGLDNRRYCENNIVSRMQSIFGNASDEEYEYEFVRRKFTSNSIFNPEIKKNRAYYQVIRQRKERG